MPACLPANLKWFISGFEGKQKQFSPALIPIVLSRLIVETFSFSLDRDGPYTRPIATQKAVALFLASGHRWHSYNQSAPRKLLKISGTQNKPNFLKVGNNMEQDADTAVYPCSALSVWWNVGLSCGRILGSIKSVRGASWIRVQWRISPDSSLLFIYGNDVAFFTGRRSHGPYLSSKSWKKDIILHSGSL